MAPDVTAMADMADPGPDLSFPKRPPTDHPELPQVANLGGASIAAMEAYTIVWKGDEVLGQKTYDFLDAMLKSDYWMNTLSEYGVGKGSSVKLIVLDDPPPAMLDDSGVKTLVKSLFAGGQVPAATPDMVLFFAFNPKTASTLQGGQGCVDYGGYHSETQTATGSGVYVSYAVNLQCPTSGPDPDFNDFTSTISHEAAEAATDAHPFTTPGWTNQTNAIGGEIGDLCVGLETKLTVSPAPDGGAPDSGAPVTYVVQRLYSQKVAASGDSDPCVPAPASHPYFNVGVEPRDITVSTDDTGKGTFMAKIEPYAFGDVGTLTWQLEGQPGPGIKVSPTQGTGDPGDTFALMVTVSGNAQTGTYPLMLVVKSPKGDYNQWFSSITVE
jgi:hypothetical protein